jgi:predicted DCC family thiol-disulfide oxidoreductase YuxK
VEGRGHEVHEEALNTAASGGPIVLYDGVCALCNRLVTFTLARDRAGVFRFASLQGELARETLARHHRDADALDTLVVVVDPGSPGERLLDRSTAALFVLRHLPGVWAIAGRTLTIVPARLRDAAYRLVARTRYRTFGKYDACPIPPPEFRQRFL